jgi:hypothetical protein
MKNPFFNLPDFGGELLDFRLALRLIVRQAFKPMLGEAGQPAPRHVVRHTMKPAFVPALKVALKNNLRFVSQNAFRFQYVFPLMNDLSGGITGSLASWKLHSGSRKISTAGQKSSSNAAAHSTSTSRKIHPVGEPVEKVRDGMWVEYNKHAVVIARGHYADGQKAGLWREYYDTGELMIEEHYLLGALHGRFATFHPNGQTCSEGTYDHGRRQGRFFMYSEDGRHVRTLTFERDALTGDVIVEESLAMA